MAHKFRPGDRIRYIGHEEWTSEYAPKFGDVGTFVGGRGGQRVVFDRSITHTRVNYSYDYETGKDLVFFNGKQSWGTAVRNYKYLGWRVNPKKV